MRRILLLLSVVAVMAAMMAVSALPAMAVVFPENPREKPDAAGMILNEKPGVGPVNDNVPDPSDDGNPGATASLCDDSGAAVFNFGETPLGVLPEC